MPKLTVIIPTLNEQKNPFFLKALNFFSIYEDVEVIVSDGGSKDNTLLLCEQFDVKVLKHETSSRAQRINFGIKESKGNMLLLHHPRSLICSEGMEYLLQNTSELDWGGFWHSFDLQHPLLKFTSWYSNNIRGKISGILYLDHCIFAKRTLLQSIGDIPPVDIFEDTLLSKKLLEKAGGPEILPFKVTTSSIRFKTNGILKQALVNQYLKIKFFMGADLAQMNKLYEKNTELNSQYDKD